MKKSNNPSGRTQEMGSFSSRADVASVVPMYREVTRVRRPEGQAAKSVLGACAAANGKYAITTARQIQTGGKVSSVFPSRNSEIRRRGALRALNVKASG